MINRLKLLRSLRDASFPIGLASGDCCRRHYHALHYLIEWGIAPWDTCLAPTVKVYGGTCFACERADAIASYEAEYAHDSADLASNRYGYR